MSFLLKLMYTAVHFCCLVIFMMLPAGAAGELEAAPWKNVVGVDEQTLPGREIGEEIFGLELGELNALPQLAEDGSPLAASLLAIFANDQLDDTEKAVYWLRLAVKNGDADSAFTLGNLYFPAENLRSRDDLRFRPDAVLGYVWSAIGLSGAMEVKERGGETEADVSRAEEMVSQWRRILLPSERVRAAELLARWPEELPPHVPLEPVPGYGAGADGADAGLPGEEEIVAFIRRWTTAKVNSTSDMAWLMDSGQDLGPVLERAFRRIQALAETGDEEAEFMEAWCRFHGTGTGKDLAAALPVIQERAAAGHPEALFLEAVRALEQGDGERAAALAGRGAEAGHARSMMLLSQIYRGDREQSVRWMEKAAAAGELAAAEGMIGLAESRRDWKELVKWMTAAMLRTPDPMKAMQIRMLIAYTGNDASDAELQEAMEAGERWHREHPLPETP